jgi:hypothetical protein
MYSMMITGVPRKNMVKSQADLEKSMRGDICAMASGSASRKPSTTAGTIKPKVMVVP